MKVKHGFIGNSSSSSYYIRKGARGVSSGLPVDTGPTADLKNADGVFGSGYDGVFKKHPSNNLDLYTTVDIPVGPNSGTTGITFDYGALVTTSIVEDITPVNMFTRAADNTSSTLVYEEGSSTIIFTDTLDVDGYFDKYETAGADVDFQANWNGSRLRLTISCVIDTGSTFASGSTYLTNVQVEKS